jgi:hypothetical protein
MPKRWGSSFEWTTTTLVLVEVEAAGRRGLGCGYTSDAAPDASNYRQPPAAVLAGLGAAAWLAFGAGTGRRRSAPSGGRARWP